MVMQTRCMCHVVHGYRGAHEVLISHKHTKNVNNSAPFLIHPSPINLSFCLPDKWNIYQDQKKSCSLLQICGNKHPASEVRLLAICVHGKIFSLCHGSTDYHYQRAVITDRRKPISATSFKSDCSSNMLAGLRLTRDKGDKGPLGLTGDTAPLPVSGQGCLAHQVRRCL